MSRDQVVICCGSRTLADDPRAVAWARTILARELASATLVVAGDARGPDAWAHEIAQGMVAPIDCERWCVNGRTEYRFGALGSWSGCGRWDDADTPTGNRRPLARNAAMVEHYRQPTDQGVTRMVAMGGGFRSINHDDCVVRLVALIDPASRTNGTLHTVTLAWAAGIDVTEHVWRAP